MRELTVYCTACDRDVHVLLTDEAPHDAQAVVQDAETLCLDVAEACVGHACPLGLEAAEAMDASVARHGYGPAGRATLRGRCEGCDRDTDLVLSVGGYATCAECGTTWRLGPWR